MESPQQRLAALLEQSIGERERGDCAAATETLRAACALAPTDVSLQLALATNYLEAGEFSAAVSVLDTAAALAPKRADIYEAQTVAFRALGRLEEAESSLRKALDCAPENEARLWQALGELLTARGDHAGAIATYQQLCSLECRADHYRLLGDACLRAQRYEEAKDAYVQGLTLEDDNPQLYLGLGIAEGHAGHDRPALRALQKAAKLLPDAPEIQFNLGIALERTSEKREAVKAFEKAIAFDSGNSKYFSFLGTALMSLERVADGIHAFEQAARLDPDDLDVRLLLQMALATSGQRETALVNTRRLAEEYPQNAPIRNVLAFMLFTAGDHTGALAQLDEGLRLAPDRAELHMNKAFVLRSLGRPEEAVASVRAATELAGRDPMAWYSAGMAYLTVGQPEEAQKAFETAIELKRDFTEGYLGSSAALIQLGKHEEAQELLKYAAEKVDPDSLTLNLNLAAIYLMNGNIEKATHYSNAALRRDREDTNACTVRGSLYLIERNYERAEGMFRKALALAPLNFGAKLGLAQVLDVSDRNREAVSLWKEVVLSNPRFSFGYLGLSLPMGSLACLEESLILAQVAVALDSQSPEAHFILAMALADLDRQEGASQSYKIAITLAPNHPNAYFVQARVLARSGLFDRAIDVMLAADPTMVNKARYNQLGFIYLLKGAIDQAVEQIEKALLIAPRDPKYLFNLGFACLLGRRLDQGLSTYQQGIAADRELQFSYIRYHLWELHRYRTRNPDAASLIQPAIDLLEHVCETEHVGGCPDISEVIEQIHKLGLDIGSQAGLVGDPELPPFGPPGDQV